MKNLTAKNRWLMMGAGFINGLFGAGGGMLAVPVLRKAENDEKKAHALCVAVILPVCFLSAGIYTFTGQVRIWDALPFLPWTLAGSLAGSMLLSRIKTRFLRLLFSGLIILAAGRILLS